MLDEIKERVCKANREIFEKGLVICTWGNVSEIDRNSGLVVIKPSGVDFTLLKPNDMVVVDVNTGLVVEGKLKPSSDTATHLEIYKRFSEITSITHTHSTYTVAFAQAGLDIPALGTTHADYFCGDIPCTRELTDDEIDSDYEKNTGKVIIEEIEKRCFDVMSIPAVLVKSHGPFIWGKDAFESVVNAQILEKVSEIAFKTLLINKIPSFNKSVLNKHFKRKHGPDSYYGQDNVDFER